MRMVPILSGGTSQNGVYTDSEIMITEDEARARKLMMFCYYAFNRAKEIRENPNRSPLQLEEDAKSILVSQRHIAEEWAGMEDPSFVMEFFKKEEANGELLPGMEDPAFQAMLVPPKK